MSALRGGKIRWTALPAMHPSSRGVACVFTPTTPTAASTAADLEIAEEQPPLRSKRRRTLRSVVRGSGVLVSPLRSARRVHQCSKRIITYDNRRRYVRSERANFPPPLPPPSEETTVLDEGNRPKSNVRRFCEIAREWLRVCVWRPCVCVCERVHACVAVWMRVRACVCVWWKHYR